jgi:hypothetical protein
LDERERILNEKMMPDVTVMVPELEIGTTRQNKTMFPRTNAVVPQYYIFIMADTK